MSEPHYTDGRVTLWLGDCLDVLRQLDAASVDAVVTDPPYGLEFMGKEWDAFKPPSARIRQQSERDQRAGAAHNSTTFLAARNMPESFVAGHPFQAWCQLWATECLRVLKPGGHLLAFGGTRTWHRLACAIEDAGFEVRDSIAYLFGSGFPKSLAVDKAIDKAAGVEREVVSTETVRDIRNGHGRGNGDGINAGARSGPTYMERDITAPATDDARTWQGWGTALKPAHEPIVVARKPLTGTVAGNVLAHGTGALNIDACRIGDEDTARTQRGTTKAWEGGAFSGDRVNGSTAGRWPANVVLDDTQANALDTMSGESASNARASKGTGKGETGVYGEYGGPERAWSVSDSGGASRFFYTAKAPGTERVKLNGTAHPTVKPLDLMRWLVRLVTPPNGVVLEPFAGSGTTVEACLLEGFRCVAIEREPDYLPLIMQRIHRRIDPVAAVRATQEDGGLFDLIGDAS
jgi:DNA modification methylase